MKKGAAIKPDPIIVVMGELGLRPMIVKRLMKQMALQRQRTRREAMDEVSEKIPRACYILIQINIWNALQTASTFMQLTILHEGKYVLLIQN